MLFFTGLVLLLLVIIQWWRDIRREGVVQGLHTSIVELGLRWGIILFTYSMPFSLNYTWHEKYTVYFKIYSDW